MEETTEKVDGEEAGVNELDTLKLENEQLRGKIKTADEKISGLEKAIGDKNVEMESMKQSLEESGMLLQEKDKSLAEAVAAYQELAVQANPGPVAEMIKGNTIDEIKESVANARALVEKVKQDIASENSLIKVPAGAPQRTALDLSTLSPREKIIYGMEG